MPMHVYLNATRFYLAGSLATTSLRRILNPPPSATDRAGQARACMYNVSLSRSLQLGRSVGCLRLVSPRSPLKARADDALELLAALALEVGDVWCEAEDPLLRQHALDERADVLLGVADGREPTRDFAERVEEADQLFADGEAK